MSSLVKRKPSQILQFRQQSVIGRGWPEPSREGRRRGRAADPLMCGAMQTDTWVRESASPTSPSTSLIVAGVVLMARRVAAVDMVARPFRRLVAVTSVAAVVLMVGHVIEVAVWAIVYALAGIAPGANPVYFAFVNYTTLGYGDVLPAAEWQLIGPITAMNGMLLFGLSTAVLFEVLRTAARSMQLPLSNAD